MPDLELLVTMPESVVDGRTQSYRLVAELQLSQVIQGRWGELDQALFVVRDEEWGTTNFLRVVEPRDLQLPTVGPLRRTDMLDVLLPAASLADPFLYALLVDLRRLVSSHLETDISIDETLP